MTDNRASETIEIRAEQVRTLFSLAPAAIAAGMGVATLVIIFTWPVTGQRHTLWIIWFLALISLSLLRQLLCRRFRLVSPPATEVASWEKYFNLATFASGLVWGSLAWLLDMSWPLPYQALVYVALLGVSSGALASNGILSRTFMLFTIPVIAPIALLLANLGDGSHLGMAALVSLYLTMLYYASVGYQQNLEKSLALQHRNTALLKSLSDTNVGLQTEIDIRKDTEAALSQEKERAEITLHSIADAVITTDPDSLINYLNPVAEKLTGWTMIEAMGKPLNEIFQVEEATVGPTEDVPPPSMQKDSGQRLLRDRRGSVYAITHTSAPIREENGQVLGTVLVFQDITPMQNMASKMAYHASHDALTGLINRRKFEQMLSAALNSAQHEQQRHVLLYLDLDQFKVVNDTCGHSAGDELLRQLAKILLDNLRQTDILARLGGDEFGVLLQGCPLDVGIQIAETIRTVVKDFRFSWDNKTFEIGASIGVVPIREADVSAGELLSTADMACYTAKDLGRNRVHVYEPKDKELARRQGEMQWISRITRAHEENRLLLYYQEIIQLNGEVGMPRHCEVLLRMRDEQGEIVSPNAFLPAAERYNLMPSLDRWVIEHAFDWYQAYGRDLVCSINLSGTSLNDPGLIPFIHRQFERTGLSPGKICFEITETAAVANLTASSALIQELRTMGCQFALDDFGSGLSSFAYLKNLPVDFIKIDGVFVRDIVADPVDHAMVSAINTVGHVMGKKTIAEFVENDAIMQKLGEIGVDYAQGYVFGEPAPLDGDVPFIGRVSTVPPV